MCWALADGVFRSAHPGHLGPKVGVVEICFAEEYFLALQSTRCELRRLYWIAQFAASTVVGSAEGAYPVTRLTGNYPAAARVDYCW